MLLFEENDQDSIWDLDFEQAATAVNAQSKATAKVDSIEDLRVGTAICSKDTHIAEESKADLLLANKSVRTMQIRDDPKPDTIGQLEKHLTEALNLRDLEIANAHLKYEATIALLAQMAHVPETQLEDRLCSLCCDQECSRVILPCNHQICLSCSAKIGVECPWDRGVFSAIIEL